MKKTDSFSLRRLTPFLFGLLSINLLAQTPTGYIADWKNDADAAYSIIHDDYGDVGVDGIWQYADTIAFNRGIKFTFGAIAERCEATRDINGYSNPYGYAKNVMMAQHGHEIISHSHSHDCAVGAAWSPCDLAPNWGEEPGSANFLTQLETAHNSISTGTDFDPVYYIFPYDRFTHAANDKLKDMDYIGSRTGWSSPYGPDPTFYRNGYENADLSSFYPDADGFFRTAVEVFDDIDRQRPGVEQTQLLDSAVDYAIANNLWANRELHNVGSSGWGSVQVDPYRQHINYLKSKVEAGELWVGTVSEVLTYQIQKLKFSSNVTYVGASNKIFVTWNSIDAGINVIVSDYLNALSIKCPITMVVDLDGLPGTWAVKQNSVDIPGEQYYAANGNLYINVYPHEGDLEIYESGSGGNNSPYVDNALSNYNLNIGFSAFNIDLKNVFEDAETTDENLIYTASGYTGITVDIVDGVATISAPAAWVGSTSITFTVEDEGGLTVTETIDVIVTDPFAGQTPFGGVPIAIPGRVEAEDYDEGDEGIAYNEEYSEWAPAPSADQYRPWDPVQVDLIGATTEYGVGFTVTGEWLEYTIDVANDGWYTVDFNVAQYEPQSTTLGRIELFIDGNSWMPATEMMYTSAWSDYQTLRYPNGLFLSEGVHILKLSFATGNVNINYVDILTSPVNSYELVSENAFDVYPNPTSEYLTIDADFKSASIFNQTGELVKMVSNNVVSVSDLPSGIYFVKLDETQDMVKFVVTK